jgi:hypothetical protein
MSNLPRCVRVPSRTPTQDRGQDLYSITKADPIADAHTEQDIDIDGNQVADKDRNQDSNPYAGADPHFRCDALADVAQWRDSHSEPRRFEPASVASANAGNFFYQRFDMLLLGGGGAARSFTPRFAAEQTLDTAVFRNRRGRPQLTATAKTDLIVGIELCSPGVGK